MKLITLIGKVADLYGYNLRHDDINNIKGRLRFAELNLENIKQGAETQLVIDTIIHVAKAAHGVKPITKVAAVMTCPRCNGRLGPVKLAEETQAQYCNTCRVVIPG